MTHTAVIAGTPGTTTVIWWRISEGVSGSACS
jgi:hypothetical protein